MRGMGRVFERGEIWWVSYYHRGQEIRESSKSRRKPAATRLLKKRLGEISARTYVGPTEERVTAFAIAVERSSALGPAAALAAHLVCNDAAPGLAGAELAAGDGWLGLRSHPRPAGSFILGGAQVPPWFDAAMRELVGVNTTEEVR